MREFLIRQFFDDIKHLNYVVQRNWDNLPKDYALPGHNDLDLFSTDEDKPKIQEILKKYEEIYCDVRSPEDDYYPYELFMMLLQNRVEKDGFFIPNTMAAFFALYYHNLIHKKDDPYNYKLRMLFKEMFPPVKCKDEGVGYYDFN